VPHLKNVVALHILFQFLVCIGVSHVARLQLFMMCAQPQLSGRCSILNDPQLYFWSLPPNACLPTDTACDELQIVQLYFQLYTLYSAVGEKGKATIALEQLYRRLDMSFACLVPEEAASPPAPEAGTPPAAEGLPRLAGQGNTPPTAVGPSPPAVKTAQN